MQEPTNKEPRKKKRRGPAPTPEEQKRKKRISVYLTGAEYAELLGRVNHKDDLSPYMRAQAFAGKTRYSVKVPELNLQAYADLARAAANLNQLARYLNGGDLLGIPEIQDALHTFRLALIQQGRTGR